MLLPVPVCLEILLAGLFLLWFTRRIKTGKILVSAGTLLLAAFSFGPFPDMLLQPLEYRYAPVFTVEKSSNAKWVVVLGGGHTTDPRLPATSIIGSSSLHRLVEGIRLKRMLPGGKLVLSGGKTFDPRPHAQITAEVALALGVDKHDLVLETSSKDTKDEAVFIKNIVKDDPFFLVTSASHMPRSMALFQKQGMHPLPAPTGHLVKRRADHGPGVFFPKANNLHKTETAVHEYLGRAWAEIRGQI